MAVIDLGFQVVWFGIVDGLDEHTLINMIHRKGTYMWIIAASRNKAITFLERHVQRWETIVVACLSFTL